MAIWAVGGDQYQPLVKGYFNSMDGCSLLSPQDGDVLISHVCPNATDWPKITNTQIFSPTGVVTVCGSTISSWQQLIPGILANVTVSAIPDTLTAQQIVDMARKTLSLQL